MISAKDYSSIMCKDMESWRKSTEARKMVIFIWKECPTLQPCHMLPLDLEIYVFTFLNIYTVKGKEQPTTNMS